MKKTILIASAAFLVIGSVAFGISTSQNADKPNYPVVEKELCPCTPDCQPGDLHCVCPSACTK